MKEIRWGIVGLGNIARKFATDLALVPNCTLQAVASSDKKRAHDFADEFNAKTHYSDYDRLFNVPNPSSKTFIDDINQNSLRTLHARVEPGIIALEDQHFQFERQGYFCKDSELPGVFNKTVSLREGF